MVLTKLDLVICRARLSSSITFWVILIGLTSHTSLAATFTWQDIKQMARSAPKLNAADAGVSQAAANSDGAKAALYPKVTSTLVASRNVDTSVKQASNTHTAAINVEQDVFSFGKTTANIRASEHHKEAAIKSRQASSVAFRAELAKAWANALYYDRLAFTTSKAVERRHSNVQVVMLRYNSGRESKGSLLSTEYADKEALIDAKEASAKSKLARGALSSLIGQEIPSDSILQGLLTEQASQTGQKTPPPHVVAASSKVEAARAQQEVARRKYYPDVTLSASAKKSASPDLPLKDPVYSAAVTLSMPIFDSKLSADTRSAAAQTAAAEYELANITAQAAHSEQTAKLNLELAAERLQSAKLGYEAAKLQAEVSRQRYTLGLMSFQDWDSFESSFIRAENKMLEQEKAFADANIAYLESAGVSLEDGP